MPRKAEDLTGQQFGWLTVQSRAENRKSGRNFVVQWQCLCLCGKSHLATPDKLKIGKVKSCGCMLRSKKRNGMHIKPNENT